jgi:hypothetical protein
VTPSLVDNLFCYDEVRVKKEERRIRKKGRKKAEKKENQEVDFYFPAKISLTIHGSFSIVYF